MKIGAVDSKIICLKFYLKKQGGVRLPVSLTPELLDWIAQKFTRCSQIIHDEPCEIELRYTTLFWNANATNVGK